VTAPVLSRLYKADIEVVRIKERVFVLAGGVEIEADAHRHEEAGASRGAAHHSHDHGEPHV
jgi:zinc/manganese transport system ATP-binding protein